MKIFSLLSGTVQLALGDSQWSPVEQKQSGPGPEAIIALHAVWETAVGVRRVAASALRWHNFQGCNDRTSSAAWCGFVVSIYWQHDIALWSHERAQVAEPTWRPDVTGQTCYYHYYLRNLFERLVYNPVHQDGRVVKALDLRSNGHMSTWVRTPLLVLVGTFDLNMIPIKKSWCLAGTWNWSVVHISTYNSLTI